MFVSVVAKDHKLEHNTANITKQFLIITNFEANCYVKVPLNSKKKKKKGVQYQEWLFSFSWLSYKKLLRDVKIQWLSKLNFIDY